MKTYKVSVHFPKARCTDIYTIEAAGIRWAIEQACKIVQTAYSSMIESDDFEVIAVNKIQL